MKPLRIALTKGRLEKNTIELLEKIGYSCDEVRNKGRRLILPVGDNDFEVVLAKAADVITYVEHGVCDLGVVGKDTILENGTSFYELLVSPPNIPTSPARSLTTRTWTCASSR